MKFNIVLAVPQNESAKVHVQCFLEIAYVIRYGLEDLGHDVIFGNGFQKDCLNILLGYQYLCGQALPKGYKYIAYQLEELSEHEGWPLSNLETFRNADCVVWDFSEKNIDFLEKMGIRAILKPIGFHPKMFCIEHQNTKDVDVLFYGSKNARRIRILQQLSERFNTKVLFGVYGKERDEWIARAKINVAIYYYETKLFDDVRISYLANNKAFTIIEDSPNRKYSDFLTYVPYEKIVETCAFYLNSERALQEKTENAFKGFSNYPESQFLQTALAQSF